MMMPFKEKTPRRHQPPPLCSSTPQTKFGSSVLISATATRVNGRIAITPRAADVAPVPASYSSYSSSSTVETQLPAKSPASYAQRYPLGRRLPMNMVVSQIASRQKNNRSPIKELRRRLIEEPPQLDPYLDKLLEYNTPGSKTGSLPHPNDIMMGNRLKKNRQQLEGPEDEIHKAFVSIYGDAEASLSVSKKLRLSTNNENEDPLAEVTEVLGAPHQEWLPSHESWSPHRHNEQLVDLKPHLHQSIPGDKSPEHASALKDVNSHYLELYGGGAERASADDTRSILGSQSETWLDQLPPSRNFVSSHSFLRTAADVHGSHDSQAPFMLATPQRQVSPWRKYLQTDEEENDKSWVVESRGKSNHGRTYSLWNNILENNSSYQTNYSLTSNDSYSGFNFAPCTSPATAGQSPAMAHYDNKAQERVVTRRQDGMPESAECRWLYESSPPLHKKRTEARTNVEKRRRVYHAGDDDEIASHYVEKESIFSTESDKEDNFSSD